MKQVIGTFGGYGKPSSRTVDTLRFEKRLLRAGSGIRSIGPPRPSVHPPDALPDAAALGFGAQYEQGADRGYIVPVVVQCMKKRWRYAERRRAAENWAETDKMAAELLHSGDSMHPCVCSNFKEVAVRHIGLEKYVLKPITYCYCANSCRALIKSGYFPSTPRSPGTVFSMRLLETLHQQSTRGSISKQAYAEGLLEMFENDHRAVLPSFTRSVCIAVSES